MTWRTWLIVVLVAYLAYATVLALGQRRMMFPVAGWDAPPQARLPAGVEAVSIAASFGEVRALHFAGSAAAPRPALVYLHGNAEFAHHYLGVFERLRAAGLDVLVMEYPGYAGADGAPTRASLDEAALAGHDWLAARDTTDASRIALVGLSIGSGPAASVAAARQPRALVLLAPFAAIADFAHARGLPGWLVRDRWDNRAALARYAGPVLVAHGRRDTIVPFAQGLELATGHPRARLHAADCAHNDCPWFEPAFLAVLLDFLAEAGVVRDAERRGGTAPQRSSGSGTDVERHPG